MSPLRIAQAQINPTVGDLRGNSALIAEGIAQARSAGAAVVTFPELAVCGYPPEDLVIKPRFIRDNQAAIESLAAGVQGITAVVGYAQGDEAGRVYNAAAVLAQGRLQGSYRKVELPNYGVFDEKRYFTPGEGSLVLEMGGLRLLITICEDIWIEGNCVEKSVGACGAQAVLNISGSPFYAGKLAVRQEIVAGFAQRSGAWVLYNNLLGGQDELIFDGGSLVVDPEGRLAARAKRFQEDLLVSELELAARAAPPELAAPDRLVALAAPEPDQRPCAACLPPEELDLVAEVYQALVLGTRDYVTKNGFKGVILGLSGGIDSSLVACVAVDALGRENVTGVTMPSQYTSSETRSDAEKLAENLGIRLITQPIRPVLDAYFAGLTQSTGVEPSGVEAENLQARIRGNILMALSNREGWMVLTTGNKSETAVGYCTLYGDMAGGFAVIKDVPKTLVYELSEWVNQDKGREVIPQTVITRPPSAELRPDQKDSDSLPDYAVLDPILHAYVEKDLVIDEIVAQGHDPAAVKRVVRLVDLNEYKRRQAPPGVKITPKAFGKDRRLPITNKYRPGLES